MWNIYDFVEMKKYSWSYRGIAGFTTKQTSMLKQIKKCVNWSFYCENVPEVVIEQSVDPLMLSLPNDVSRTSLVVARQ